MPPSQPTLFGQEGAAEPYGQMLASVYSFVP
jgi:hypothetical protein